MEFSKNQDLVADTEAFVHSVYLAIDEAAAQGLDQLRRDEGIVATCKLGCSCCCRYHIQTNLVEARTLVQYIKRELSAEQIEALQERTRRWHQWDNSQPGRYGSEDLDESITPSNYDPCCPLLVDNTCSIYPVRPVVCRTHFVSSDPSSCCAAINPKSTYDIPTVLKSVVAATKPHSNAIRDHLEDAGIDFSRSIMLLPQWLAIEMDWDFALAL